MSWEYGLVLAAIIAFFAEEIYRHPQLRRHAVAILTNHKAKLYDFLDPVIDDIATELQKEVGEHDKEWITDEVQRQILEVGVYIFTEMGRQKAKEIVREIVESVLAKE